MSKYTCKVEGCSEAVTKKTKEVCDRYPELNGDAYCPTHRNEKLKEFGYICSSCGINIVKPGETICYDCSKKGLEPIGSTAVATIPNRQTSIVSPVMDTESALKKWKEFQDLKTKIKTPEDSVDIKGKEYLTKSFWRKLATFFNLSNEVVVKEIKSNDKDHVMSAYFEVAIIAPNGRRLTGVGACSRFERTFAHPEHDIIATAFTRAFNRGVADMVGGGETSAEEIEPEYAIKED